MDKVTESTTDLPNGNIPPESGIPDSLKRTINETNTATSSPNEPKTKQARILEKIKYDDLELQEIVTKAPGQLNLAKVERYLHGPVPIVASAYVEPMQELEATQYHVLQSIATWNTRTPHKVLVSATAAVNALGELSPGGALMRGFQEQSLARTSFVPSIR